MYPVDDEKSVKTNKISIHTNNPPVRCIPTIQVIYYCVVSLKMMVYSNIETKETAMGSGSPNQNSKGRTVENVSLLPVADLEGKYSKYQPTRR